MNFSYDRKRNVMFNPMHHSFANYCSDTMAKSDLHRDFSDELFLNNLHLIPDPLKKNLADTIITSETPPKPKQKLEESVKMPAEDLEPAPNSTLSGIFSFFSGVFNSLSGAMFRPKSPVYHDCYNDWQVSNSEMDKIGPVSPVVSENMSSEVRSAAKTCEGKLNQIRCFVPPKQTKNSVWLRKRPKKVFIEPGSVEENFEDAFTPEDFITMPNQTFVECYSPYTYQNEELYQTGALKTKVEPPWQGITDVFDKEEEHSVLDEKETSQCGKDSLNLVNDDLNLDNVDLKSDTVHLKIEKGSLNSKKINVNLENEGNIENNTKQNLDSRIEVQDTEVLPKIEIQTSEKPISDVESRILNIENKDLSLGNQTSNLEQSTVQTTDEVDYVPTDKETIITSCEDKLSRLKALLCKSKKSRPIEENPNITSEEGMKSKCIFMPEKPRSYVPEKSRPTMLNSKNKVQNSTDKHYKNPHRTTDKRKKSKLKKNINDDMTFANEIDSEIIDESPLNSYTQTCLGDYFDEITGRFRSTSTADIDDSFQIVFNDTPRCRIPSECDSEDSFIIFEDSPDSCYTSNDVFGDSDTDSDSDVSDSGCSTLTCKLSHSLSRTVSNLTDDSLYAESGDEIDSTNVETMLKCDEMNPLLLNHDEVKKSMLNRGEVLLEDDETDNSSVETVLKCDEVCKSLLIDDEKKKCRRHQPVKTVHFSNEPPKVHLMRVWAFAARQARAGHWERFAIDRERFKRRIADVDVAVSWVLKPQHRSRVMFQRFMPWWNQQKRRELAEKKLKEEEDRKKQEELVQQELAEKQMEVDKEELGILQQEKSIEGQELLQQQLEKQELEKKEFAEKQMEDERIKEQELLQQQELVQQKLERRELERQSVEERIRNEKLLQEEFETDKQIIPEDFVEHQELCQQARDNIVMPELIEDKSLRHEELLQQELERKDRKLEEITKIVSEELLMKDEHVAKELIPQELVKQQELLQQKLENNNKSIEEANLIKNIPLILQNGESSENNFKTIEL